MSIRIIDQDDRQFDLPAGEGKTIAQAAFLSGNWSSKALCSGLGRCGRCRVQFTSVAPEPVAGEEFVLSSAEIATGWRLGCKHVAASGMEVFLPVAAEDPSDSVSSDGGEFDLAIDLGTTSLHWEALSGSEVIASGKMLNPQLGAGGDIMSRLSFARTDSGAKALRMLVVQAIEELVASLPGEVRSVAVAGNPGMTNLLLGRSVAGLSAAPYTLEFPFGCEELLSEALPPAYILSQLAPFVGGDLTAGLAALVHGPEALQYPFVLSDMGTNGEFILAMSETEILIASVPLGPALEGIGLACGNVAGEGVVSGFRLAPTGLVPSVIGGGAPSLETGMTGTAYLSLVAHLKNMGLVDDSGRFCNGTHPLAQRIQANIREVHGERRLILPGDLYLAATDIEEMLKVKAAFNSALSALLQAADYEAAGLKALYIAGAMGEHVQVADLEALGFIPTGLGSLVQQVGNTSLAGARLMLSSSKARVYAESLSGYSRLVDLTGDPLFGQHFLSRMRLTYIS